MIYFGQSRRGQTSAFNWTSAREFRSQPARWPRLYLGAAGRRACRFVARTARTLWQPLAEDARRHRTRRRDGGEARFCDSAGEWQDDIHAVGVALKLNDGTGPYAFNCGAPAFRFTEDRLRNDIGPRLVAMVRNIEAALGGARRIQKKKKAKSRNQEGNLHVWPRGSDSLLHHRRVLARRSCRSIHAGETR